MGASSFATADGKARLVLVGEVGQAASQHMRAAALPRMQPPLTGLVVDLTRCDYLEPAGVDLLGSMFGRAYELGAAIDIVGASPNVNVILAISGLLDLAEGSGQGRSSR